MGRSWLLLLILLAPLPVHAFNLVVSTESVTVPLDATKAVNITLLNAGEDRIVLTVLGEKPWMLLSSAQVLTVPGEPGREQLFLTPKDPAAVGLYKIRIAAFSLETGVTKGRDIYISVVKGEKTPILSVEQLALSGDWVPAGELKATVHLKNDGLPQLQGLKLNWKVYSEEELLYDSEQVVDRIVPDETKVVTKLFYLPENLRPGNYTVDLVVSMDGKEYTARNTFVVAEKMLFSVIQRSEPHPFGYGKVFTVRNRGNKAGDVSVYDNATQFDRYFFQGTAPTYTSANGFVWETRLAPGEERIIKYRVDYSPLIIFLFSAAIALWFVLFKLRVVKIAKYVMQAKHIDEGEEFTIGIDVRNHSGTTAKDVIIKDFAPSIFEVSNAEGLRPQKRNTEHGTEIVWKIGDLFDHEERVLSYKIRPVIGIHGRVKLPSAVVVFRAGALDIENKSFPTRIGVDVKEEPGLDEVFEKKRKKGLF